VGRGFSGTLGWTVIFKLPEDFPMHEKTSDIRSSRTQPSAIDEWIEQVRTLHRTLEVYPADLIAREKLATLLEELQEWEGALFQWRRMLTYDSNRLDAWEGLARCRKASHSDGCPALHSSADQENL
jgi:hypothetical protein